MLETISKDMAKRSKNWVNSMCATNDEVSICWLLGEIDRLQTELKQKEFPFLDVKCSAPRNDKDADFESDDLYLSDYALEA